MFASIIWLSLLCGLIETDQAMAAEIPLSTFDTEEHEMLGNNAHLRIDENEAQLNTLLTLPNGVNLTYGQIVALGADFYGVPDSPIIDPERLRGNSFGRRKRFLAAYSALAVRPKERIMDVLNTYLKLLREDNIVIETGIGELHRYGDWDRVTGGVWCAGVPVVFGKMMKLAAMNFDHFQPQVKKAYRTGHKLAIEKAREAANEPDEAKQKSMLMEAYSMDAFAAHFLTDSFSAGHIRTPRYLLHKTIMPTKVGDALSNLQHNEDGKYGLRVKNRRGDTWIAYGDKDLRKSSRNMELAIEAVQLSVRQIYEAFNNQTVNMNNVIDIMPFVDPDAVNNSPLFSMKDDYLYRRDSLTNLQDRSTSYYWNGAATLAKLKNTAADEYTNPAIPYHDDEDK